MITETTNENVPAAGWILYDANCGFCADGARRLEHVLRGAGFALVPMQDPAACRLTRLTLAELLVEMKVRTPDGRVLGGVEALLFVAGRLWWARPLATVGRLPVVRPALVAAYRWFAAHRHAVTTAAERVMDANPTL